MTIFLSEEDVASLLDMKEVVEAVEEAFRQQGSGRADNQARTRSRGAESVLNVMHANGGYLGRGGLKAYMSSRAGTKFLTVLFDDATSQPLAVMGADALGRYRTGAATGVATRHLYGTGSAKVALFGSGKQALTQALAVQAVLDSASFRVWSPSEAHREAFVKDLGQRGMEAAALGSPAEAASGADVVVTVTSSKEPFLDEGDLAGASHVNICGGNVPTHAEITGGAVGGFDAVVVDDAAQGQTEYGDLIRAAAEGKFDWGEALELSAVVSGRARPSGRTLFKSGGVAIEDVATASVVYEKAKALGRFPEYQLV